jgi:hypothetical protein
MGVSQVNLDRSAEVMGMPLHTRYTKPAENLIAFQ